MADSSNVGQRVACRIIRIKSVPSPRLQINFNFFIKSGYFKWIHHQDSIWLSEQSHRKNSKQTAVANINQFSLPEITGPIKKVLEPHLAQDSTKQFIEYAWEKLRKIEYEFIGGNKIVDIDMEVDIQDHIFSVGKYDCFIGERSCGVCLEDFSDDDGGRRELVIGLPCSHFFHVDCIQRWMKKSGSCPLCRHHVPETEDFLSFHRCALDIYGSNL